MKSIAMQKWCSLQPCTDPDKFALAHRHFPKLLMVKVTQPALKTDFSKILPSFLTKSRNSGIAFAPSPSYRAESYSRTMSEIDRPKTYLSKCLWCLEPGFQDLCGYENHSHCQTTSCSCELPDTWKHLSSHLSVLPTNPRIGNSSKVSQHPMHLCALFPKQ